MILRCPSCGREGNVPDRLGLSSHRMRCRRCGARFLMDPGRVSDDDDFSPPPIALGVPAPRVPQQPAMVDDDFLTALGGPAALVRQQPAMADEGFSAGSDPDIPEYSSSPYDSQPSAAALLGGEPDDSQVELPAFTDADDDTSGELEAAQPFEAESAEFLVAVPWYYKFIESWGRVHFYAVVAFTAASLLLLGFLLWRGLVVGEILSSATAALLLGVVGTIAFLLLSLSATAPDHRARRPRANMRLLIQQSDRAASKPMEVRPQSRTGLSHPVG